MYLAHLLFRCLCFSFRFISLFASLTAEAASSGTGSASSGSGAGGTVDVKGWAWAGGGRGIARVDVSTDGGANWHGTELVQGAGQPAGREWAWVFFEAADVPHAAGAGQQLEVVSRAVDKCYNVQPEKADHIWNMRGLGNNSWFRRSVKVEE
jgi:sulfite oxidase